MTEPKLERGERVLVDLTEPLFSLTHKVAQNIIVTAVVWVIVGLFDRPNQAYVDPTVRNGLVAVWLLYLLFQLVIPVWKSRRRLFIVTTQRVIVRLPRFTRRVDSIPLRDVYAVRRSRSTIQFSVLGHYRPLQFHHVARAKKVAAIIEQQAARQPGARPPGWEARY